jgi:flagellar capping protein FliD
MGGLVSGLDTAGIIDQLLEIRARPIVGYNTSKAEITQQADVVAEIGKRIANLQASISLLKLDSTVNQKTFSTSQAIGSTGLVGVTANADAASGVFEILVKQLATSTTTTSTAKIGNTVTSTADLTGNTFDDASAATTGTGLSESIDEGTYTVGIDGTLTEFTITAGDTLDDVITALDAVFGAGFATLSSNKLVFDISIPTGTDMNIGTAGDTSNFLDIMGLTDATRDAAAAATVTGSSGVGNGVSSDATVIINDIVINIADADQGASSDNADKVAAYINIHTDDTGVIATVTGGDFITLTHEDGGSGKDIVVSYADAYTGLDVGTTSGADADTIQSIRGIGNVQTSAILEDARLAVALSAATGGFDINGVSFTYDDDIDSINDIISRINSSTAGVVASYDSVEDKLSLRNESTGSESIQLADTTGNFLTATGVLAASQTIGENAIYSIDTVSGGADQTSASNVVAGVIPGLTLDLQRADDTNAITVTIAQNSSGALGAVESFVAQFNETVTYIEGSLRYDADEQMVGVLQGDGTINSILSNLRSLVMGAGDSLTGQYQSLGEVGFSFKPVGGDSLLLELDSSKLIDALIDSPSSVADVFAGLETSSALTATANNVASISGSPDTDMRAGTYTFTIDTSASPNLTVVFDPENGDADTTVTYTVAANDVNTDVIPGMSITLGAVLADGSDVITVTRPERGIAVKLDDYLFGLLRTDGVFDAREGRAEAEIADIDDQIARLDDMLDNEERSLIMQFSRLEATIARMQGQQNSLAGLLGGMG